MSTTLDPKLVAVVPAYNLDESIIDLIQRLLSVVAHVIVVDDKCPKNVGALVERECNDSRVQVIYNSQNLLFLPIQLNILRLMDQINQLFRFIILFHRQVHVL